VPHRRHRRPAPLGDLGVRLPSTASSTILARRASAALSARDDAILASFSRSPIRNASGPATHLPLCLRKKETFLSQH